MRACDTTMYYCGTYFLSNSLLSTDRKTHVTPIHEKVDLTVWLTLGQIQDFLSRDLNLRRGGLLMYIRRSTVLIL